MESLIISGNIVLNLNNIRFFERVERFVDSLEDKIFRFIDNLLNFEEEIYENVEVINENVEVINENVEEINELGDNNIDRKIELINLEKLEIIKNKKKFDRVLDDLLKKRNKSKLTPTQLIISKSLKGKKCLIIYLGLFYDFLNDKWDKLELLKEIIHTSIKLKIPIVLIGENNPLSFIPKLNNALSVYFSNSNYITPYHYKSRWFDTPKRIENNKISMKPCKVSLIQMVNDIIDQYQLDDDVYKIIKLNDINFG